MTPQQQLDLIIETCRKVIEIPQGDLWNYGTTPTAKDKFEWKVRADLAQEILSLALPLPSPLKE